MVQRCRDLVAAFQIGSSGRLLSCTLHCAYAPRSCIWPTTESLLKPIPKLLRRQCPQFPPIYHQSKLPLLCGSSGCPHISRPPFLFQTLLLLSSASFLILELVFSSTICVFLSRQLPACFSPVTELCSSRVISSIISISKLPVNFSHQPHDKTRSTLLIKPIKNGHGSTQLQPAHFLYCQDRTPSRFMGQLLWPTSSCSRQVLFQGWRVEGNIQIPGHHSPNWSTILVLRMYFLRFQIKLL